MAWEQRKRGGWYYTRSRRINGRVVREYVGGGLRGELAAAEDARKRAVREAQRKARAEEQQRLSRQDVPLEKLNTLCRELVQQLLEAAGYCQRRGEWRKRRGTCD